MRKLTVTFVLILGLLIANVARATNYRTLTLPDLNVDISTWSDGWRYNTVIPGIQTWNGVKFSLASDADHHNVYMGNLTIHVNVFGVTKAYTIINSSFGNSGTNVGSIEFFGTNSAYYKMNLVEGINVRDHYDGYYCNEIDGKNAIPAFTGGYYEARLDMQIYTLPEIFSHNMLQSIKFNYDPKGYGGNPFIAAATVEANPVPIPSALYLLAPGLLGLVGFKRKYLG
jgi:hypothetical protein